MKKILTAVFVIVLTFSLSLQAVYAQQLNNLYFLENSTVRHTLNPSFQPLNNFYFGVPVVGNLRFGFISDFSTYKSAGFDVGHALNFDNDKDQILQSVKPQNYINAALEMSILNMGFRMNSNYWTFAITEKVDAKTDLPYGFFSARLNGLNVMDNGYSADISGLTLSVNAYTEAALGYSRAVGSLWGFGAKAKMLWGNTYFSMSTASTGISNSNNSVAANANIAVKRSSFFDLNDQLELVGAKGFLNYLKPYGIGGAFDLGVNYKPLPYLTLSLAVNDLGLIQWNKMQSVDYQLDYVFDEQKRNEWLINHPGFTEVPSDSVMADILNSLSVGRSGAGSVRNYLSPKLNLSAEIGFWENKLNLGVLSRSIYRNDILFNELTSALTYRPSPWFNMGLSYSITNGNLSNLGFGFSARVKKVSLFLTADYVPLQYMGLDLQQFNAVIPAINLPVGYNTNRMNFGFGISYVLGSRKDSDQDGIDDKFDKCPGTPLKVKVDGRGCPVDTDKDGVPDYLDQCQNTPKAARMFVDRHGCPLDSDGDGVYDYQDRCPDTPVGAKGFVDESGCPYDGDQDGVWDFMDHCPDTPAGIEVDSSGCPLDSDGDGVPDYLDLCPGTPAAAKGFVDSNGCPTDADDDGVLDYLDLCPDTPIEARGFVDMNGCLIDADDDGIPDYVDQCLDTPMEARGMVDHRGCPVDTDFDGIPDYMDDCPRIPGVTENGGCPEVKNEVRALFSQAVQGIQFDEKTMNITKPSYRILDQIVTVLKQNRNYNVEIHGYTDNRIPESLSVMKVSEVYANRVKDYFISKGIDKSRLTVKGFGDAKPVASNNTEGGRARNRRVELLIVFEEIKLDL